jgi:probable HAF family extracellular repeat protein
MRSRFTRRIWVLFVAASLLHFAGATAQTYSVVAIGNFAELQASAISASGLVAGTVGGGAAFLSDGSTVTTIEPLYARMDNRTAGYGVNDRGQVTGISYGIINPGPHAFLFSNGTVTDLGTLPGGDSVYPSGPNASGQITGYASVSANLSHAFLYSHGAMTDLGTLPGGTKSAGNAINDGGAIAGQADTAHGDLHAFVTNGTSLTDIGTLAGGKTQPGYTSSANAINNAGQVAGTSSVLPSGSHAFLYSGGTMTDLGTLGGPNSAAGLINNAGQIAGSSDLLPSGSHAFLYSGGTMTDLGTLGGPNSAPSDLNNSGQVLGTSDTATGQSVFLYANGVMTDLNSMIDPSDPLFGKVSLDAGVGINDSGWIVVNGRELNPVAPTFTAFLLVPFRFSPRSLTFSNQPVGTQSASQPITLTNLATSPLAISKITPTSGFTQTNDCPATLTHGSTCTIQVAFSPSTAGSQSGVLKVTTALTTFTLPVALSGGAYTAVSMNPSVTAVTVGVAVTLTWTSSSTTACTATGGAAGDGWAGTVPANGTKSVVEMAAGTYTYTLTCPVGGSLPQVSATVKDSAPASSGGGGGSIESLTLAALLSSLMAKLR